MSDFSDDARGEWGEARADGLITQSKDNTLDEKIDEVLLRVFRRGQHHKKPVLRTEETNIEQARQQIRQLITDEVLGVLEELKAEREPETTTRKRFLVPVSAITKIEERLKPNGYQRSK